MWPQVLTIVGANLLLLGAMLGTVITLYLHTDKKIDAIAQEMKDFHGKLEKQDAEFKAQMKLTDEKFRYINATQSINANGG